MTHNITRSLLTLFFAASLMLSTSTSARAEDSECSLAGSAGKWSFTDNGTVIGIGPRTAVGVFTFDGSGNLKNGRATSSLNGAVADETFSGTYSVKSDCTGKISVSIFSSGVQTLTVTLNVAFEADMRQMRGIFTSAVTPDGTSLPTVIGLEGRRQ